MLGVSVPNPLWVHSLGRLQWLTAWRLQHPLFPDMAGAFLCPHLSVNSCGNSYRPDSWKWSSWVKTSVHFKKILIEIVTFGLFHGGGTKLLIPFCCLDPRPRLTTTLRHPTGPFLSSSKSSSCRVLTWHCCPRAGPTHPLLQERINTIQRT